MLEKKLSKKKFRLLVYIVGCLTEFLGFALLFNPNATINFLTKYSIIIGLLIIFLGYLLAVSMRWKP